MVILSHMRSRTSSPDSGDAMALVTEAMSVWMERPRASQPDREAGNQAEPTPKEQGGPNTAAFWEGGDKVGVEAHHQAERTLT